MRKKTKLKKPRIGKGVINSIIDNLPFEVHVPGYNFLGPGTKLQERIAQAGINPLDDAAKEHDIAYSKSSNLKDRHIADKLLANKAWERVKATDANFLGEKIPAWFTTTFMNIKRKLGAGNMQRKHKQRKPRKKVGRGNKRNKRRKGMKISSLLAKARSAINPSASLAANIEQSLGAVNSLQKSNKGPFLVKKRIIPLPKQGGFLPLLAPIIAALGAIGTGAFGVKQVADAVSAVNDARKNIMGKGLKYGGASYIDPLYFYHPGKTGKGHGKVYIKRGKNKRLNLHF